MTAPQFQDSGNVRAVGPYRDWFASFISNALGWAGAEVAMIYDTVANALRCGQQRAMPTLATQNYGRSLELE